MAILAAGASAIATSGVLRALLDVVDESWAGDPVDLSNAGGLELEVIPKRYSDTVDILGDLLPEDAFKRLRDLVDPSDAELNRILAAVEKLKDVIDSHNSVGSPQREPAYRVLDAYP